MKIFSLAIIPLVLFANSISAQLPESMEVDIGNSFRLSKSVFYSKSEISKAIVDSALLATEQNEPVKFYGCCIKAVKEQLYTSALLNIDTGLQIAIGFMPANKNKLEEAKIIYAEYVNGKINFIVDETVTANPRTDINSKRRTFEKDGLKITVEDDLKIITFSIPKFKGKYFILPEYKFNSFKE